MTSAPAPLCLALFQPEIPQNAGTMLRLCACLGLDAALIEPAAFPITDRLGTARSPAKRALSSPCRRNPKQVQAYAKKFHLLTGMGVCLLLFIISLTSLNLYK